MFLNLIEGPPIRTGIPCIGSPFPHVPAKSFKLFAIRSIEDQSFGVVNSSAGFLTGFVISPFSIRYASFPTYFC